MDGPNQKSCLFWSQGGYAEEIHSLIPPYYSVPCRPIVGLFHDMVTLATFRAAFLFSENPDVPTVKHHLLKRECETLLL